VGNEAILLELRQLAQRSRETSTGGELNNTFRAGAVGPEKHRNVYRWGMKQYS
jgi:hypothetical protein